MPPGSGPGSGLAPDSGWLALASAGAGAKSGSENFPVALRVLPARYRRHLEAVYNFARTVDDAGDLAPREERPALLAQLKADVHRLYAVAADGGPAEGGPRLAVVRGLAGVVAACGLPMDFLIDLISANEQDQIITRYETYPDLLDYCRLSANPVGRIVLYVFGCYTPERARLSDDICTALQLAEHWQDVGEDMRAGRIYIPAQDLRAYGCAEQDLLAPRASAALRQLIAFESSRASALLDSGAALVGTLRGWPRAAVAGYLAGGRATLTALARADYDVLATAVRPAKPRVAAELLSAFMGAR
jgi:squalene synthase HpnC